MKLCPDLKLLVLCVMAVASSLFRCSSPIVRISSSTRSSHSTARPSRSLVLAQANRICSVKNFESASAADLNFESPLRILKYPSTLLRAKNKRVDFFDEKLKKLTDEMFDVMYKHDGVGLAAPQVGINVQLMVLRLMEDDEKGEDVVLVNPKITKYSKKTTFYNEGCLSFPDIFADVERPESVTVNAMDNVGAKISFKLSEFPARVFQHEYDHLQGVLFIDRMKKEVLDTILPEIQDLEKGVEGDRGQSINMFNYSADGL